MQAPVVHRQRHPPPPFIDHTPRDFEVMPFSPPQSPEPLSFATVVAAGGGGAGASTPAGKPLAPSTVHADTNMGNAHSLADRDGTRKTSSTVLRQDSAQGDDIMDGVDRPDSWSMHCAYTGQLPYSASRDDLMMTSTSLLHIPKDNPSHDLAFFLRTTGPVAPHRRPSRAERPRRSVAAPKNALRFLKLGSKRSSSSLGSDYDRAEGGRQNGKGGLNDIVEESPIPPGVQQKKSISGRKYLALQVPPLESRSRPLIDKAPMLSSDPIDSHFSVSFADDGEQGDVLDNWVHALSPNKTSQQRPQQPRKSSALSGDGGSTLRIVNGSSPIRPAASCPPSPQPGSADSFAESYMNNIGQHPATKASFIASHASQALSSHPPGSPLGFQSSPGFPSSPAFQSSPNVTVLRNMQTPEQGVQVAHSSAEKEVEIKHPSPRRFASHPVLLQRASSITSSLDPRSVTDSPGPPPRSPLRLRRDQRGIDDMMQGVTSSTGGGTGGSTPKAVPSIMGVTEYYSEHELMKPTVTTDCTGPIKRPRSRGKGGVVMHPAYPLSRKAREERTKARKMRDRPSQVRTIDQVVHSSPSTPAPRARLRKARPQIQIPALRPAPLVTRQSSSASSVASWKKITENTRTPVSPVPSLESPIHASANDEGMAYSPISPPAPATDSVIGMAFSPVMVVAEEAPAIKTKPTKAKVAGKSYAPRPRSASIPRSTGAKRRSRAGNGSSGGQTPAAHMTPHHSPTREKRIASTPPLPSQPPSRALPPTPPASGSERTTNNMRSRLTDGSRRDHPVTLLPSMDILHPNHSSSPKRYEHPLRYLPPQSQTINLKDRDDKNNNNNNERDSSSSKNSSVLSTRLEQQDAMLEALSKRCAMYDAALRAMLMTNGSMNEPVHLNGPLYDTDGGDLTKSLMAWQNRIARRSVVTGGAAQPMGGHAPTNSVNSLDMYISTRRDC